ncbi:hypothetical protein LINPERHAP1_LOCUS13698, partial [Linum perenne]
MERSTFYHTSHKNRTGIAMLARTVPSHVIAIKVYRCMPKLITYGLESSAPYSVASDYKGSSFINFPSNSVSSPACAVWPLDKSGVFSVRSLARVLIHRKLSGVDLFPSGSIWVRHVPTKVVGFIWQVVHERVSTIDNLIRRGMLIPN